MEEEGREVVKVWEMGRLIATAGASGLIASAGHSRQERLIKNDGMTGTTVNYDGMSSV